MAQLKGFVTHIIYRNNGNGYTVFELNTGDEITCVGTFQSLEEGEILELEGDFTEHAVYGSQFKVSSFKFSSPEDAAGMERYLGSGAIKGVGASLAARIVKRFGADTFRIIEEEPERLAEIKGISERKAMDIASQMEEKHEMREAMVYLQKYGISNTLAVRIYETYGSRLYRVLEENPYQLADDIDGIGFRKADELAARIGIHTDSDFRIRSGILYTLLQASGEGHMYLPGSVLIRRAAAFRWWCFRARQWCRALLAAKRSPMHTATAARTSRVSRLRAHLASPLIAMSASTRRDCWWPPPQWELWNLN